MDYAKLRAELARDEGKRLTAYKDTNGYWTIGVGHLLAGDAPGQPGQPRMTLITDAECDALLNADIDVALNGARSIFDGATPMRGWFLLDDARQRAIVNMIFNRGIERVRTSTTITPAIKTALLKTTGISEELDQSWWKAVSDAILASPWATQIGTRAERIAEMLRTGEDIQ